jgi:hypothetical protein
VQRADLVSAAREAGDAGFDMLIACAFNYEALSGPWPICMMLAMPAASVEQPTKFHQFPAFIKLNGETANFTTSLNGDF